jgi:hypothetical protein
MKEKIMYIKKWITIGTIKEENTNLINLIMKREVSINKRIMLLNTKKRKININKNKRIKNRLRSSLHLFLHKIFQIYDFRLR